MIRRQPRPTRTDPLCPSTTPFRSRTTMQAGFLDSTGRAYSTAAHTLPSARGNGEPLTGRFTLPNGASVVGIAAAEADTRYLLCSDHGYGFITRFDNFCSRNKAGKALLNPGAAGVLPPTVVTDPEQIGRASGRERVCKYG